MLIGARPPQMNSPCLMAHKLGARGVVQSGLLD
jgi:hypothetical protein